MRPAYSTSSSRNTSAEPASIYVAGNPDRSSANAGDARGEAAAGTGPGDDDAVRVDAQLVGVLGDPAETVVAVVDRDRAAELGGEAVVHRDHNGAQPVEPLERDVDLREPVAEHPPAAVHPVDARCAGSDAGRDKGCEVRGELTLLYLATGE